jgi:twitching motility protein PilT
MSEPTLKILVNQAAEQNASDLHLTDGMPPLIRKDGELLPMGSMPVSADFITREIIPLVPREQRENFTLTHAADFAVQQSAVNQRLRIHISSFGGVNAVAVRLIPESVPAFDSLGMPAELRELCLRKSGMILICGSSGSGKSTTLASLIEEINGTESVHIITLEDPVEYVHVSRQSLIHQQEIGRDCASFEEGISSALRSDVDVLVIGEMRTKADIAAAVTMAETGHLVMATLHTRTVEQSLDRLISAFQPELQNQIRIQLSYCLVGICCQQLVPLLHGGRTAAAELLINNSAAAHSIRSGHIEQIRSVIQVGRKEGMQTMEQSLAERYLEGSVSLLSVMNAAFCAADLQRLISRRGEDLS